MKPSDPQRGRRISYRIGEVQPAIRRRRSRGDRREWIRRGTPEGRRPDLGTGSNLQALIDACADPAFPAEIVLVLSNKPTPTGWSVPGRPVSQPPSSITATYADKPGFEAAMDDSPERRRGRTGLPRWLHASSDGWLRRALA